MKHLAPDDELIHNPHKYLANYRVHFIIYGVSSGGIHSDKSNTIRVTPIVVSHVYETSPGIRCETSEETMYKPSCNIGLMTKKYKTMTAYEYVCFSYW